MFKWNNRRCCPFQWHLRMSRNQRIFCFVSHCSILFVLFFRCQSSASVLFASNENFCRLSLAIYCIYSCPSLSNCIDCSVIVNMSIVSSLEIMSYMSVCVCARATYSACRQIIFSSHKWHSFWSDDNFKFSFCYLFSLLSCLWLLFFFVHRQYIRLCVIKLVVDLSFKVFFSYFHSVYRSISLSGRIWYGWELRIQRRMTK